MRKTVLAIAVCLMGCLAAGCGSKKEEAAAPVEESATVETPAPPVKESDKIKEEPESAEERIYGDILDLVLDLDAKRWDGFSLIDLDDDGIFELFATCINGDREDPGIQPYMIASHNDKGVVVNDELQDGVAGAGGYRGTLYYLEGLGILHESAVYAPLGVPADTVYVMEDGRISMTDSGYFTADPESDPYADDFDPLEHGEWKWNEKTVTEDEYKKNLRDAIDNTEGKPLCEINWKNRAALLKKLTALAEGREDSSGADLKKMLLEESGAKESQIAAFIQDDLDGDGEEEAFAVIGEEVDDYGDQKIIDGTVWFAGAGGCEPLHGPAGMGLYDRIRTMKMGDNEYVLFDEVYATSLLTYAWSVSGGEAVEAPFSTLGEVLTDTGDGPDRFRIMDSSYDGMYDPDIDSWMGHTWKHYYFFADENGDVREYAGTETVRENVIYLSGADVVGDKLPAGDKMTSLFCRGNGLIVMNYEHTEDGYVTRRHVIYDLTEGHYVDDAGEPNDGQPLDGLCKEALCPEIASYPELPVPD